LKLHSQKLYDQKNLEALICFSPPKRDNEMKTLVMTLCLTIFFVSPALAETRYISDLLVVTIRTEPNNNAQVLATVLTGAPLEVLEEFKNYLHVRTEKGVEGYVRSQYVTKEQPKAEQIKRLTTANIQLQQQVDELSTTLTASMSKTENLSSVGKELERIKGEYQALQKASAGVLQITRERDQLQQENSDLAGRMQKLKEENNLYLRTGVIKWFLAGAGVLCFGWLLGKVSRKKKRNYL